jgi:two-component system chemotaxis response regulator CheY
MNAPGRVLVVDDDEDIRDVIEIALAGEGYEVQAAPDGAVALSLVGESRPDLILLDMRMPVMDGWEFARAYHEMPGPHAPIVVLTAAVNAGAYSEQIGAAGFLAKPFDLDQLFRRVDERLRPQ